MISKTVLLVLLLFISQSYSAERRHYAAGRSAKITSATVEDVINIINAPQGALGNMFGNELQTNCRLAAIRYLTDYTNKTQDNDAWLKCIQDQKNSIYARLIACCFLPENNDQAQKLITKCLKSANLRHRYNAAYILSNSLWPYKKRSWGVNLLIDLLKSDALVQTVNSSSEIEGKRENFPEGDYRDIMYPPLGKVCWILGERKEQNAVIPLINVLQKNPTECSAARALGKIGDKRAIPVLVESVKKHAHCQGFDIEALGMLKAKEAIQILIERLQELPDKKRSDSVYEADKILNALLAIGDKQAIEPIKEFILKKDIPAGMKSKAETILVQFGSENIPRDLIEQYEKIKNQTDWKFVSLRGEIIRKLGSYPDQKVIDWLSNHAKTSPSGYVRRETISSLGIINSRASLLVLANLLNISFPENLTAEAGWKGKPCFSEYFPELISGILKKQTNQDFGRNSKKWREWIESNRK